MFFAYLGMMIVARFLGPPDFGLISLASAVATIASTVVMVGMPKGIEWYIVFRIVFIGKTFYSSTTNNENKRFCSAE
jgi:O-antigen/teichoic acid export membrane protein